MNGGLGTLIIFSGLPGSGKSTLAERLASQLGATYLRIDTIEQGLRDICEVSQLDGKGYRLSYRIAQENLRLGSIVVADSVNPWNLTRKEWNSVAEEVGARFINVEVICSDKEEHRIRVETRVSSVPGLKQPTWKEVLEREYHAWTGDVLCIDTSKKNVDTCLDDLLSVLASKGLPLRRPEAKGFRGMVVEESLKDNRILNRICVESVRVTESDNPEDRWHTFTVTASDNDIACVQSQLKEKGWYAHFWDNNRILVIFPDRIFELSRGDRQTWKTAIEHGRGLGIPVEQLDFLTD